MFGFEFVCSVISKLANLTHPEKTHIKNNTHPGGNWKLKTVCPVPGVRKIDKFGFGSLWQRVSIDNPEMVKLNLYAYDWYGNEIPNMISVWVDKDFDVIFDYDNDTGVNIKIVSKIDGCYIINKTIKNIIDLSEQELTNPNSDIEDVNHFYEQKAEIEKIVFSIEREYKPVNLKVVK